MPEFNTLLQAEIPKLRRYARVLCRANPARADDLVHDTLVRGLEKQHLWQPGTNLRSWLFTIMHNLNVNEVRTSVRWEEVVGDDVLVRLSANTDAESSRKLMELDRALRRLPEEMRQVILLVGLEGLPYGEAAAVLGIPTGIVRSRLSRGRHALRVLLDEVVPVEHELAAA
ncbi:MAG: sigma-70 family RNA polymerase sigma factor [Alphaproteobacteria bacterium]|nr:sigma-70 family RNA polymerase sigma factor [Alphaproteobacteria bacterium]